MINYSHRCDFLLAFCTNVPNPHCQALDRALLTAPGSGICCSAHSSWRLDPSTNAGASRERAERGRNRGATGRLDRQPQRPADGPSAGAWPHLCRAEHPCALALRLAASSGGSAGTDAVPAARMCWESSRDASSAVGCPGSWELRRFHPVLRFHISPWAFPDKRGRVRDGG